LIYSSILVLVMVLVQTWTGFSEQSLVSFGIYPRTIAGLKGIMFSPLVHGDWEHLGANSVSFVALSGLLTLYFPRHAFRIFWFIYLIGGIYTWCLGREAYHIGSSGVVYGLASFIFFSGLFRGKPRYIAMSLLIVFLYGSMIWGLLPFNTIISWEAHISGTLAGIIAAFYLRNEGKEADKYEFEWQKPDYVETFDPEAEEENLDEKKDTQPQNATFIYHFIRKNPENS